MRSCCCALYILVAIRSHFILMGCLWGLLFLCMDPFAYIIETACNPTCQHQLVAILLAHFVHTAAVNGLVPTRWQREYYIDQCV